GQCLEPWTHWEHESWTLSRPGAGKPRAIRSGQRRSLGEEHRARGGTSTLLAASPLVEGVTARYFEDCREAEPHQPGIRRGVAAYALDPEQARRLRELSLGMLPT